MATSMLTIARVAGALLGAGGAVVALADARPTASFGALPARASFTVPVSGEFGVTPAAPRPALTVTGIEPGAPANQGGFSLRNQTGRALAVGLEAGASARDLDGLLRVRLTSGSTTLADTTLQGLRGGTAKTVRIPAGKARRIRIETWIPVDVTDGFQGRNVAVTLTPTFLRPAA